MTALPSDFYERWRAQNESRLHLREPEGTHPPEKLLQSIWHHQRLQRDRLQTTDGRRVRVLHPGFWNREAGPDFRGAVVQLGAETPRAGDVEIDLTPQHWNSHQHHKNPNYTNVVLHVVWKPEGTAANALPLLALEPHLDAPLAELQTWASGAATEAWPEELRGACSAPLRQLAPEQTLSLLQQAALVRFRQKAFALETRARQAGWEQALWEGLFRGLGYKQNTWPMQQLAELLPQLGEPDLSVIEWQARLLGVGGFLDGLEIDDRYLQDLWNHWWREREKFAEWILPRTVWRMNGLRPANQPQRRLALAAHWLGDKNFIAKVEQWFLQAPPDIPLPISLLSALQSANDDFWSWRWSFHSPRLAKVQPLLGESRTTDLAVNVILPWFWVRARAGKNERLLELAERRFLAWPAAQDNSLLRLARQRLLGRATGGLGKFAATQQGLLQIVRDFCDHSNAACDHCIFPEMVRRLRA